jgi:SAM-dependent methyltransferase
MDAGVYRQLFELEDTHWWFAGRRRVVAKLLESIPLPPDPVILDAGCGTGRNLIELRELGEATGIDPAPEAVELCRERGLSVTEAPANSIPLPGDSFDLAVMLDVLEHIEDEQEALTEIGRVTRPGGALLITVPAYEFLWSSHDESHHHFRRYTRRRLLDSLRAGGWRAERLTFFNSTLLAPIATVRKLGVGKGSSDYEMTSPRVGRVLEGIMGAEAAAIGRGIDLPAGVSIAAVCRPA